MNYFSKNFFKPPSIIFQFFSECFFSLTGTPISKKGKDTYLEFSYPPEEKYLDRYFITDSIRDGFTVRLVYQPRLEKEVHLKKDMLETFLEVEFDELSDDIKDKVEEGVKKRLNALNMFLENPKRIELVARDIAEHFKENVDGKYKAMVVTASRKACAYYKLYLDKGLPKEHSEVVMTYNIKRDARIIKDCAKPGHKFIKFTKLIYGLICFIKTCEKWRKLYTVPYIYNNYE